MVGGIEKDIIIEMWKIVNLESVRELIEKKVLVFFYVFRKQGQDQYPGNCFVGGRFLVLV